MASNDGGAEADSQAIDVASEDKMTVRWYPDTCDCSFDVEDDWTSAVPITQCQRHAHADYMTVFNGAHKDNVNKNLALRAITEDDPTIEVQASFSPDGTLSISTSKPVKAATLARLQNDFGKTAVSSNT